MQASQCISKFLSKHLVKKESHVHENCVTRRRKQTCDINYDGLILYIDRFLQYPSIRARIFAQFLKHDRLYEQRQTFTARA